MSKIVTIIMPIYSSILLTEKSLSSILSLINLEFADLIISVNTNDKEVLDWAIDFSKAHKIRYIIQDYMPSFAEHFFVVSSLAQTKYVWIAHTDDIYHKDLIVNYLDVAISTNYSIISSNGIIIDESDREHNGCIVDLPSGVFDTNLFLNNFFLRNLNLVVTPTVWINCEFYKATSGWSVEAGPMADFDLWLKLLRESSGYFINQNLIKYRKHSSQDSTISYSVKPMAGGFSPIYKYFTSAGFREITDSSRFDSIIAKREFLYLIKCYVKYVDLDDELLTLKRAIGIEGLGRVWVFCGTLLSLIPRPFIRSVFSLIKRRILGRN